MIQLKDTAAFEELQRIVGNDIAGIFLARLNEFSVPEDRLQMLADEICYDIASAMHAIGDYEIPGASPPAAQETINHEVASSEPAADDMGFTEEITDEIDPPAVSMELLEDKTDEIEPVESATSDMEFLEEKTDEIEPLEPDSDFLGFMEEKTDEIDFPGSDMDDVVTIERTNDLGLKDAEEETRPKQPIDRVLSQEYIVKLLNEAKSAMA